MSMKKSSDTIGNRTSDLTVYSAVPQPTAKPGEDADPNRYGLKITTYQRRSPFPVFLSILRAKPYTTEMDLW
jgi:hypothetical protein